MKYKVLFVLFVFVVLLGSACGGGGADITLEDYFGEVWAIVDEYREEQGQFVIEQQAREADSEVTEAENVTNSLDAILPLLRQMMDAFQDLDPPVEVDPAHRDASEALSTILEVRADLAARLADAESDAEMEELLREPSPDFEAATALLDEACFKLQDIADDKDINVDLDCALGLLQGRQFLVEGAAMVPTLPHGTLVEHSDYGDAAPKRGDIIVFRSPTNPDRDFIKRIIGLPGDVVEVDKETSAVKVNGGVIDEPYLGSETTCLRSCGPWEVPGGSYFVMGDNRQNSSDSRQGWFVPEENILGLVEE